MRKGIGKLAAVALLAAPLAVTGFASPAVAQESKLAVIDVRRLVTDSVAGKEALEKLRKLQEEKVAEARTRQEELDGLRKRISEGRLSLAEDKLADLEKELEEKATAFRRFQEDAEREISKRQEQAFAEIERQMAPVIEQAGQEGGYTLIFNKFQSGLVYADEASDITDLIIQRFDAAAAAAPKP
ncbi:MAG: OmpH family outer membrane protein [Thermoanaerobaculia bacterium]|nr:MAG: OmpH family outer membrane protein [Thermoanaerobaculia bacterium]MBZ0101500.1 OmpH family outer membrane protein [Thermoanaerobaculia bacterium]